MSQSLPPYDSRILVTLRPGKRVLMPAHQIRVSSGATHAPTGNRWSIISRLPLPDAGEAAAPAVAPEVQKPRVKRRARTPAFA